MEERRVEGEEDLAGGQMLRMCNVILELCLCSLRSLLQTLHVPLPPSAYSLISEQIFSGLRQVHSAKVVHRDVSSSNFLLSIKERKILIKLADFGLARPVFSKANESGSESHSVRLCSPEVGTLQYKSPEVLLGSQDVGVEADVWGAGVVAAELPVLGKILLPGVSVIAQWMRITKIFGPPSLSDWPELECMPDYIKLGCLGGRRTEEGSPEPMRGLKKLLPSAAPDFVEIIGKCLEVAPRKRLSSEDALLAFKVLNSAFAEEKKPEILFSMVSSLPGWDRVETRKGPKKFSAIDTMEKVGRIRND